jgi:uncharacterized protein YcbX
VAAYDNHMTCEIAHLFVYPVKSLGGTELSRVQTDSRGFTNDRRWMLIDNEGQFLTQRIHPDLAFFSSEIMDNKLIVHYRPTSEYWTFDLEIEHRGLDNLSVTVWSDTCNALLVSTDANAFFSHKLKKDARLVFMPDSSKRLVDANYNSSAAITAFTDGFPILVIGSASLDELNRRLALNGYAKTIGWDRFRPNLVVKTNAPFEEDYWKSFRIGEMQFDVVKPCSRCIMTTIDQQSSQKSAEPLRTLAGFRTVNNNVMFGQNVICKNPGNDIQRGDEVIVDL